MCILHWEDLTAGVMPWRGVGTVSRWGLFCQNRIVPFSCSLRRFRLELGLILFPIAVFIHWMVWDFPSSHFISLFKKILAILISKCYVRSQGWTLQAAMWQIMTIPHGIRWRIYLQGPGGICDSQRVQSAPNSHEENSGQTIQLWIYMSVVSCLGCKLLILRSHL